MEQIEQLSVNTIRFLSAEAIQKANSGHPGLPLDLCYPQDMVQQCCILFCIYLVMV